MNKTTNVNPTQAPTTLTEKVAAFKLIARDSLRMELISARLSKIANLENNLTAFDKEKTAIDHDIKVENYEISKLDTDHPNYEDIKKDKTEIVTAYTKELEEIAKEVEKTTKLVTEQKEAVAKIELGETKVCLDALNCLVDEMVKQSAVVKVS